MDIYAWVNVFRIIHELRTLRLTSKESQPQNPELGFFGLFSVYLKTIDHLNLDFFDFLLIAILHYQNLEISEILNFTPMY